MYLLTDRRALLIFRIAGILDTLGWLRPAMLVLRLGDQRDRGYREEIDADADGRFTRFRRVYGGGDYRVARVVLTTDRALAALWQQQPDARAGWRALTREVPRRERHVARVSGRVYDASDQAETARFVRDLTSVWKRPDATVNRIRAGSGGVLRCFIDSIFYRFRGLRGKGNLHHAFEHARMMPFK